MAIKPADAQMAESEIIARHKNQQTGTSDNENTKGNLSTLNQFPTEKLLKGRESSRR